MATQPNDIKRSGKCTQLRQLLTSPDLEFIMEAHNGISARIVEETGFKGIWASGLAISAQFGVRDSNEASWTQVVDMLEFMSDVTTIPILLDGDTGYGNFNNMRRLVKKLEQRRIAGVCIEDKQFPKINSFINGERQPLANISEFCGKLKAGKDSQQDPDFCIIARIEALIAGWGISEALRRAEAYHEAGADGILIHSKLSRPTEIIEFAREWSKRAPLIIVPTTYYSTPTEVFRNTGVSLVIWANHMIRAAVAAMEKTGKEIIESESVANIEDNIATVKHIFALQGADELTRAQERYLNPEKSEAHAIILAASRGNALYELTHDRPKVMLTIGRKTLLRRLVDEFKKQSINQTTVVAGYKHETIDTSGIKLKINAEYETTGELSSLLCAKDNFHDNMIITYGDLLFRSYILQDLLDHSGEIVMVVDSDMNNRRISGSPDYAYCSRPDDRSMFDQEIYLKHISENETTELGQPSGRWIGMLRVQGQGVTWFKEALNELQHQDNFAKLTVPDLLNYLVNKGTAIKVHYIHGHWLDVNTIEDIDRAGDFTNN
jgi:phosphoenolpyruvate phosphomutase